jgi:DNA-binding MarR family transcriptional regulator
MSESIEQTENLVMQILATATTLERGLDSVLSFSRGISFSEYRLLKTLQDAQHGMTRVALAQALAVSPSGVTRALKPLEKLGYVVTEKNSRDARQSLAKLTGGGEVLLSNARLVLADFMRDLEVETVEEQLLEAVQKLLLDLRRR